MNEMFWSKFNVKGDNPLSDWGSNSSTKPSWDQWWDNFCLNDRNEILLC